MVTENAELVTYGVPGSGTEVQFRGTRLTPGTFQQSYSGFRTGPGADRTALTDLTKAKLSDFSGGLDPTPGIKSWLRDLNKFSYNEGWQTRIPEMCILPFDLINQTSITSEESIAGAVAAGWRGHIVVTSLSSTTPRFYMALGHKVYRNVSGSAALEVCYTTTTGYITSMAVLNVNGTPRLCCATTDADDDIFYVADPTGTWSGNITVLVALTDGDYITGMQYFPTLGEGANILVGEVGGVGGVWWKDTTTAAVWTLEPVVTTASKNSIGNAALQTYGPNGGSWAFENDQGRVDSSTAATRMNWVSSTVANVLVDDTNGAQFTVDNTNAIGDHTGPLVVGGFFSHGEIPKAFAILGVHPEVRHREGSILAEIFDWEFSVIGRTGSQVSMNEPYGAEWATTAETVDYGDSADDGSDHMGTDITGEDAPFLALKLLAGAPFVAPTVTATQNVEYMTLSLTGRVLGNTVTFPNGGWMITPNPAFPERMAIVTPATRDDAAAITETRIMWYLDFAWEPAQERPVFTYSRPNVGMAYVHHAVPFQGGYSVAGGNKAGPGTTLKHVDSSGNLRDFAFPAHNGNEIFYISSLIPHGSWMILDCVASDNGDRQWWFYNNGRYFPDTILQSLSDGLDIAAQPIPFSTVSLNLDSSVIYSVFPNSTSTAVARQFIPPDLSLDPRIAYPTEVLTQATVSTTEDTPLKIRGVELDLGPEEANKAIVVVDYLGRRISAATGASYGSVTLELDVNGDTTLATPDVTNEFTSAFESYDVPSAGVAYRSIIPQIKGEHDPGSAESPDGLPFLLTTVQDWPHERVYIFEINELVTPNNIFDFMDRIDALADSKLTQPIDMSTIASQPAKFDKYLVPQQGMVLPPRSVQPAPTHFIDAEGNEVFIGIQFHTVPGTGSA